MGWIIEQVESELVSGTTAAMTTTADTSVIAAPAPSSRIFVTQVIVSNNDVDTDTVIDLKDGTTILASIATKFATAAVQFVFDPPLKLSDGAAFQAANKITASSTYVSASGYIGD